jgi:NTE family protein
VLNTVDVPGTHPLTTEQRHGAFWAINTEYAKFHRGSPALPGSPEATKAPSLLKTRLKRTDSKTRQRVVNWVYAACDAALRTYFDHTLAQRAGYPYPDAGVG